MSDTTAIFLAAPTSRPEQIRNCLCNAAPGCRVNVLSQSYSLLAFNFNLHWVAALNSRAKFGWTDFAMIHADVTPAVAGWLGWLTAERRRIGADILSVVLPAREDSGLTSTALCHSDDPEARATRLTLRQVHNLPETFNVADCQAAGIAGGDTLLVNTGLWICDFSQPWVEQIHFEVRDRIRLNKKTGRFQAFCWPEDWNFSRRAAELGLSVYATRGLPADHDGFTNDRACGQEIDMQGLELAAA